MRFPNNVLAPVVLPQVPPVLPTKLTLAPTLGMSIVTVPEVSPLIRTLS